jgi:hypothetical protein
MLLSVLFETNMLGGWIVIVLAHLNSIPRVDMSLHSDTLSRFCANQSLPLLLDDACLTEKLV